MKLYDLDVWLLHGISVGSWMVVSRSQRLSIVDTPASPKNILVSSFLPKAANSPLAGIFKQ